MRITLVQLSAFVRKWTKLGLSDDDLRALEDLFIAHPGAGEVIPATGGLRKIRFAPPSQHRGKRGAFRVIYAFVVPQDAIYLFTIYGKNEQVDLLPSEKQVFRQILDRLRERHRS